MCVLFFNQLHYFQINTEVAVGAISDPNARRIRIVHISDTHMKHEEMLGSIPPGDILVHSGDFAKYHWTRHLKIKEYVTILQNLNNFFSKLPHAHKIFVAGNHEMYFEREKLEELQSHLPNATYLQDTSVTLDGIKYYGSPWTLKRSGSFARGYAADWDGLVNTWKKIPTDTDVLITHLHPFRKQEIDEIIKNPARYSKAKSEHIQTGSRNLLDTVLHKIT